MGDYIATAKTSYVKIKDVGAFKEWMRIRNRGYEIIGLLRKIYHDYGELYALTFPEGTGIPYINGDGDEFDIFEEVQGYIEPSWAMIFMEVGSDEGRFLLGTVSVVTPREVRHHSLSCWVNETLNKLDNPHSIEFW